MVHKIHTGQNLPSVRKGQPYFIVGFGGAVENWSNVAFPWHDHGVAHCTVCHSGQDQDNWRTRPSLAVCSSCHDNVTWETSALPTCASLTPTQRNLDSCAHTGGPTASLNSPFNPRDPVHCLACHGPNTPAAIDLFHHGD
jgi:OmcA/MtrC family decaheme c-type cytochrome